MFSVSLTAVDTDTSGAVSAASAALNLTVDTLTPSAPVILGVSPTSGAASALTTSSDELTLTGDALAGSTVSVYDGSTNLGTTTANAQGVWSFTTSPTLSDAQHSFTATATSPAGLTSAASSATLVNITAGISSFSPISDQWSAPIMVGGSPYFVENANINGNAPWAIQELNSSTLQFTLQPGDLWSDNGSHRTEIDGSAAFLPTNATINISYQLTVLPGMADTNLSWQILGQLIPNANTSIIPATTQDFAFHLTGADGAGSGDYLAVQAFYVLAGQTAATEVSAPGNPYNGYLYVSPTPIVRGQAYSIQVEANVSNNSTGFLEIWINGAQVVNYHGPLGYDTVNAWKEGIYEGWTPTQTVTVDYANTMVTAAPRAPVITGDTVNGNRAMLSGSAEANSTVSIYDGSTLLGTTAVGSNGAWSYMTGALSTGAQSFTATAKDSAGNVSAASLASSVTIAATSAPVITAVAASAVSGEALVGTKITFTLTMSSSVTVTGVPQLTLNDGGVATYASGSGSNTLTFQYTVSAGNSSTSALAVTGLSLPNGASIADASNNAAILTGASQTFNNLVVDTNPVSAPVFVSYTANSNGSFTIKGTAAANTTVHELQNVYTGTDELVLDGTASVDANGNWTYTTPSLINGTWDSFIAYDTNSVGDISASTTNNGGGVSTSDLPSPVVLSNDISAGAVTLYGVIPAGYGATGAVGATVLIFDGATQIGSATTTTGGAFTFTTSTLTNGVHTFTVEAQNASGASAPSVPLSITVTTGLASQNSGSPVTVAYYLANQAALDAAGSVKISDTAVNVAPQIDKLNADAKVTAITLSDAGTPTLQLTAAQALNDTHALGVLTNSSYNVDVVDTAADASANFDALNVYAHLAALTLTDSGTPTLSLTAAQALNDTKVLAAITNANYGIAVTDTGANISADFNALNVDAHITTILPTGGSQTLNLSLAQILNDAHALSLLDPFSITVTDTAANLNTITSADVAAFATDGVTLLASTNSDLSLSVAQRQALGSNKISVLQPYSGGTTETVTYNANGSLLTMFYTGLTGLPYTSYTVTYGANGSPTSASYSNGMTKTWTYNANGTYSTTNTGVTGQAYTAYTINYGTNGLAVSESYNNGMMETWTYNTNGTYSTTFTGVKGQAYTSYTVNYGTNGKPTSTSYSNGIATNWTYNSDGSSSLSKTGITGLKYTSDTFIYSTSNTLVASAFNLKTGAGAMTLNASGVTVSAASGSLAVSNGADTFALTSHAVETVTATGRTSEIFAFNSGFGSETISGFTAGTSGSDVLSLKLNMFNGLSSTNTAAQNAAILINNNAIVQSGTSVLITDLNHDTITLAGQTLANLKTYESSMFKFA